MNEKVVAMYRIKNEERWITSCLRSVFSQSYKNIEVIIVDNKSTDHTVERSKSFAVKIVSIEEFFPGKAINDGIRASSGDYIVCLSAHCIPVRYEALPLPRRIVGSQQDVSPWLVYILCQESHM